MTTDALNLERVYQFRFAGIAQETRDAVWAEIAPFVYRRMGSPEAVLDPAAGRLEFLNRIPAPTRWAVDLMPPPVAFDPQAIQFHRGDVFTVDLPEGFFDGVFMSNFLEHLPSVEAISELFTRLSRAMRPGGTIAIMGPNFKYCVKDYFDCADHKLALTDVSVSELLYAAGFEIRENIPRFLPYSFRGKLPPRPALVRAYLRLPWAWRIFGRQFLVLGRKA